MMCVVLNAHHGITRKEERDLLMQHRQRRQMTIFSGDEERATIIVERSKGCAHSLETPWHRQMLSERLFHEPDRFRMIASILTCLTPESPKHLK